MALFMGGTSVKQNSWFRILLFLLLMLFPLYFFSRKLGDGFLGDHLLYFVIGCASAVYWFNTPKWNHGLACHPNLSLPLLTFLCFMVMPDRWEISIWVAVFISALIAREGLNGISIATLISGFLQWAPLRYIGKISYSIYLVHMVPLFGTLWFFRGSSFSATELLAITMVSTIVFTLILSAGIYRWVEAPFINYGRTLN